MGNCYLLYIIFNPVSFIHGMLLFTCHKWLLLLRCRTPELSVLISCCCRGMVISFLVCSDLLSLKSVWLSCVIVWWLYKVIKYICYYLSTFKPHSLTFLLTSCNSLSNIGQIPYKAVSYQINTSGKSMTSCNLWSA